MIRGRKRWGTCKAKEKKTCLKVRYVGDRTDSRSFFLGFFRRIWYTCKENRKRRRKYEPNYYRTCFKKLYGADVI